jgi:hypothetical protein
LTATTIKAATAVVVGGEVAAVISAEAAALTKGVLNAMLLRKLRTAFVLIFTVAFLALGGGTLVWHTQAADRPILLPRPEARTASKHPEDENLKNTLLALDKHMWEATAKGDMEECGKFLADDLVSVSILGKYGKADAIEAGKRVRTVDWTIRDADVVRVSKEAAVLTYRYDCKILSQDGRHLETRKDYRVVYVWALRSGGWVLVFSHDDHGRRSPLDIEPKGLKTEDKRE